MKNMKLLKHTAVMGAVLLAVFAALAFVIPFVRNTVFWVAFVGTLLMFGVCACAYVYSFGKNETPESKLLGWPVFRVSYIMLPVQLVISFALMGMASFCPVMAAVIVEVVVFAVAFILLTVRDAARQVITVSEEKLADNTAAWKAIRAKAAAVAAATGNADMKKLAQQIRFADPMPTALDKRIADAVELLQSDCSAQNLALANALLVERNSSIKASKK